MLPFIYPYQANVVRNELNKLLRVVYFVGDYRVYQSTKDALEATIDKLFGPMTSEQATLFEGITKIKGQPELNRFMENLRPYVISFRYEETEIRKLFKKEKKLNVPSPSNLELQSMTYVGWRDISKNVMYLVYPYLGELTGIRARYTLGNSHSNVCCLCNQTLTGGEIGLVVAQTKATTYRSTGNYMCLDSVACNQRITGTQGIDDFFHKALTK